MSTYLADVLQPDQTVNPVLRHLGIIVEWAEDGTARLRLEPAPFTAQGAGMLSGGIIATLLDEAMAHAVLSRMETPRRTATVDLNIQYMKGVRPDTVLYGVASIARYGSRVVFVKAEAQKEDTTVVAAATASFILS